MKAGKTLGIQQAFPSDNNPKGHADTARVMRTLTEECLWLQEWTTPFAFIRALAVWITDNNDHYLDSTLGYHPPAGLNGTIISATGLRSRSLDHWGALHVLSKDPSTICLGANA